jgi:threonine dehydrogenase-like Zn-dependent dehydrogenase
MCVRAQPTQPTPTWIWPTDFGGLRQVGATVCVIGCGPIGLLLGALARLSGAAELLGVEPSAQRAAMAAESYGFDHVYAGGAPASVDAEAVADSIRRRTDGRGVDVVFEASGAPSAPALATRIAKRGGKARAEAFHFVQLHRGDPSAAERGQALHPAGHRRRHLYG